MGAKGWSDQSLHLLLAGRGDGDQEFRILDELARVSGYTQLAGTPTCMPVLSLSGID
jgi:hypothetical protein